MKKLAVVLIVAVFAGMVWVFWLMPGGDDTVENEPATDVAVHVAKIERATLRDYVTAYGVVEPEPAGERPAAV